MATEEWVMFTHDGERCAVKVPDNSPPKWPDGSWMCGNCNWLIIGLDECKCGAKRPSDTVGEREHGA